MVCSAGWSRRLWLAAAIVVMLQVTAVPTLAGFEEGQSAFLAGDYALALREWRALAQDGDAAAQFGLGALFDRGYGVPRNPGRAARWYPAAAQQGHARAQWALGNLYKYGYGVLANATTALEWHLRAAALGLAEAQNELALQLAVSSRFDAALYSRFPRQMRGKALGPAVVDLLRAAARQGLLAAQVNLGTAYLSATIADIGLPGLERDPREAYFWLGIAASRARTDRVHVLALRDQAARFLAPGDILEVERRIGTFRAADFVLK